MARMMRPNTATRTLVCLCALIYLCGVFTGHSYDLLRLGAYAPAENWLRLGVWLLIGFAIYFGYGRRHSVMARYLAHEITAHGVSPAGALVTHTGIEPDDYTELRNKIR